MHLSDAELKTFDEDGYLFFPGKFSQAEAALLKQDSETVFAMDRKEVWRESSGAARTAFAAHRYNEGFRRLGPTRACSTLFSRSSAVRSTCTSTK